ncbi:hypothetical protein PILCRDRAFT_164947 [Piloderma croceum F 1598]|uniref:Uncharacterized protein n=1 Tax=Piloderma croceum (strain F 1598) TaxID=765440 RepID=A0A0C3GKK6_PILCF|nr:hypothetical protein PILCRDRAFT_164947 [Piloderma croceum F 1598]
MTTVSVSSTTTTTTTTTTVPPRPTKHASSRSLSFFPKDTFSSLLLRTHVRRTSPSAIFRAPTKHQEDSPEGRNSTQVEQHRPISILGAARRTPDYANNTMLTARENDAILNPGPKKSENKLYNFFRPRSRSRSKSQSRRSQSLDPPVLPPLFSSPVPPLPTLPTSTSSQHTRHSSLGYYENRLSPPPVPPIVNTTTTLPTSTSGSTSHGSGSKPITRSQSRPLSSATTGTHSTITSLVTPTQTRMARSKGMKYGGSGAIGAGRNGAGRPASTSSSVDLGSDIDLEPRASTTSAPSSPSFPPHPTQSSSYPPQEAIIASSSLSAATSKQPTSTRLRLHNLFGIPLTNPRRSSFGSRSPSGKPPNTNTNNTSGPSSTTTSNSNSISSHFNHSSPRPTSPQPLPSKYTDMNMGSAYGSTRPGSSYRRATSPNAPSGAREREREKEKEKRRSATAPASWLPPRFFSGSGSTIDKDRDRDRERYYDAETTPPPPPMPLTVLNADSTSTLQTQTTHTNASSCAGGGGSGSVVKDRGMSSSIHAPRPSQSRSAELVPPVPRIIHTPATPQKDGEAAMQHRRGATSQVGGGLGASLGVGGGGGGTHGRNRSLVVYGDEGVEREVKEVKEVKRGRWSPRFFGGGDSKGKEKEKEKERMASPVDANGNGSLHPGITGTGSTRRSKHGAFDFESSSTSRRLSGGSSSTAGAIRNPVITAPSMAKSRSRESRESSRNRSRDGKLERTVSFSQSHGTVYTKQQGLTRQPSTSSRTQRMASSPTTNNTGPSAYSGSTTQLKKPSPVPGGAGLSSSWGRTTTTTANSMTTAATHGNNTSGKRRIVGLSHGSFPFEPAVPSPSSPAASEFGVIRSGDSGYQESAGSTSTNGAGGGGHRGKGRSLDLNIGLSWAPTKVKQEAVMPSFTGMSVKDRRKGVRETEEERRKFESGVSEIFRNVLGEGGFATFKKCMSSDIRRFDAQLIPFDGPSGLITRVEKLLNNAPPPTLDESEKQELMDRFIRVVLQHA